MKTQISQLIKGDHRENRVGTPHVTRTLVALKVREENPETMTVKLRGRTIKLTAEWSVSKKSVTYIGEIPVDLYQEFFGDFGLPKEPKTYLKIFTDCTTVLSTNSEKGFFNYIPESEIEIL